MDFENYG